MNIWSKRWAKWVKVWQGFHSLEMEETIPIFAASVFFGQPKNSDDLGKTEPMKFDTLGFIGRILILQLWCFWSTGSQFTLSVGTLDEGIGRGEKGTATT